jgi:hypothetical protein
LHDTTRRRPDRQHHDILTLFASPASPTMVPRRRTRHLLKCCLRPAQRCRPSWRPFPPAWRAGLQGTLLPSAWRAGLHGSFLPPLHLIPNPSNS